LNNFDKEKLKLTKKLIKQQVNIITQRKEAIVPARFFTLNPLTTKALKIREETVKFLTFKVFNFIEF